MGKRGMKPQQAAILRTQRGLKKTNLQRMRVKRGLSQNELAELSGVPLRRIQSYEQGNVSIDKASIDTLCDLVITLNCDVEDILESKELIRKVKYL